MLGRGVDSRLEEGQGEGRADRREASAGILLRKLGDQRGQFSWGSAALWVSSISQAGWKP